MDDELLAFREQDEAERHVDDLLAMLAAANKRLKVLETGLHQAALDLGNVAAATMLGSPFPVSIVMSMQSAAYVALKEAK